MQWVPTNYSRNEDMNTQRGILGSGSPDLRRLSALRGFIAGFIVCETLVSILGAPGNNREFVQ